MADPGDQSKLEPEHECQVCKRTLPPSESVCPHCGAAHGLENQCPHCGIVAAVEPSASYGYRCKLCGAPRLKLEGTSLQLSGDETEPLKRARRLQRSSIVWRAAGVVLSSLGILSVIITVLVIWLASFSAIANIAALLFAALPWFVAWLAWQRGRHQRKRSQDAMDEARLSATRDLLEEQGREVNSEQLSKILNIDTDSAEHLLARLSVEDEVRSRITSEGDLVYTSAFPRVRVSQDASELDDLGTEALRKPGHTAPQE